MYAVFSCINTYLIELSYTIKHPGTEAEEHICNSEKERKISFLTFEYYYTDVQQLHRGIFLL